MKQSWKNKIARTTGNYSSLDKKALGIKKSWDEVSGILEKAMNKKKKKT